MSLTRRNGSRRSIFVLAAGDGPCLFERPIRPSANAAMNSVRPATDPSPTLSLVEPLLNADEAARLLGNVPAKTVLQLAREGRIPSVRIGRHVRFVRSELEAALASRRAI